MRLRNLLIAAVALITLCAVAFIQQRRIVRQADRIETLRRNVESLVADGKVRRVRDSLRAVEVGALVVTLGELQTLRAADARLIADLRIRLKDARSVTALRTVARDTVRLAPDTVAIPVPVPRPRLAYRDRWASISYDPNDSTLAYEFRDSVTALVHVAYARRFLWWRWRPSYRATVVSHNPRCVEVKAAAAVVE